MQFEDRRPPSWQAREDASREILVGLYVRDAIGALDPSGVPHLLGTGLPPVADAPEMLTWWWMRWWIAILDPDEGRFTGLPSAMSELGDRILKTHLDNARTWAEVAHESYADDLRTRYAAGPQPLTLQEVVREREAALGRRAHPFRLRIEVLPLTSQGIWWIGEHAIAVDEGLHRDADAYRLALAPIVERLA